MVKWTPVGNHFGPTISIVRPSQHGPTVVVKVGPGKMGADGKLLPMDISVGDQVKFRDFAGNEVDIGTEEFSVVKIMDILAKF